MAALVHDLHIDQGTTFQFTIIYVDETNTPVDLTGYTAELQVRKSYASPQASIALTSSTNGGIAITPDEGKLVVTMTPEQTSNLNFFVGVYDCVIQSPDGVVTRLLQGKVYVSPRVTQ